MKTFCLLPAHDIKVGLMPVITAKKKFVGSSAIISIRSKKQIRRF
jgi:hypothetical protein